MSSIREAIEELRERLDDLERQTSENEPSGNHHYASNPNLKIFGGAFTNWDFIVLCIYTLIIMLTTKFIMKNR
ncbi:hypothetical protein M9Y10_015917 [Tritrichomonas musculus]|uniref:Uncharacterized protein n=1 Tax=Tritrichomonas musculus TaxID=1915356 RepID=A0ABR2I4W3_9EUKA